MSQASASASNNLSDALGSIGATESASATDSKSGTVSASASATDSASASVSASGSKSGTKSESASALATQTVAESQSLTDAPSLGTESATATASVSGLLTGAPKLTDLPTLSGFYSYPAPTVPPIANAPYMAKTNLPENFVFIIVGAVIAFVAILTIGWRILTSWSINRRFQQRHEGGGKASYTPLPDFKQKPPVASAYDMKDLGNLPKNFSSVPSLFFSPTAEVARHSTRPESRHLPAGHYRDAGRA